MSDSHALLSRIEALERDLSRAWEAFDTPKIDVDLRNRVKAQFATFFNSKIHDLARLRERLDNGSKDPVDKPWDAFRRIAAECDALFAECLAFLAGVQIRSAGIDDGVGMLADAFLDDLSTRTGIGWQRVTVLGEETLFSRVVDIVRLRFPEFSVWGLPAAAHEFGHVVARKIKAATILEDNLDSKPFQDIVDAAGGGQVENYLQELFADAFATYATGPAFLCRSVILRFDPSVAYSHGTTHPMSAMRVYVMRRTLERMSDEPIASFDGVLRRIDQLWQESLTSVGQPLALVERVDPFRLEALEQWFKDFFELLETSLPPSARLATWLQAERLWGDVERATKERDLFERISAPHDDDGLPDVLNAAWLYRIHHPHGEGARLAELERAAKGWCEAIVRRGGGGGGF